jgi:hypothetical protein
MRTKLDRCNDNHLHDRGLKCQAKPTQSISWQLVVSIKRSGQPVDCQMAIIIVELVASIPKAVSWFSGANCAGTEILGMASSGKP